jgi:8-oxo-dGTP pyrophosphatase MutT (NUDIX family)
VLKDDKLLLMERWRPGMHYFSVPGGGIEPGETAEQTVVRELLEETGCQVAIDRLLYTLHFADGTEHSVFLCNYIAGEPHLPADSPEALETNSDNRFKPGWVPVADLPQTEFFVWQPIKVRLLHDLEHGFAPEPVTLASEA